MHINTGTIYRKTGKLLWTRLLTGLLLVGSAGILLGAFMLVGILANRFDIKFLLFLAWIPAAVLDITILRHFFSYRITAGYAAVVQNVLATWIPRRGWSMPALKIPRHMPNTINR